MTPVFTNLGSRGELVRPTRFFPFVDWPHEHKSFAFGPFDMESGISSPDMTKGNYQHEWVAYVEASGAAFLQKKIYNGLWDGEPRPLLTLIDPLQKISLDFSQDGTVILCYLRQDATMGVWWRDPQSGLPALLELDSDIQDIYLTVENKDDPENTDIFLWYFKSGSLYLRLHSEDFATEHGPYVSGLSDPVIIQAGINHRYGYQVDYRDQVEE